MKIFNLLWMHVIMTMPAIACSCITGAFSTTDWFLISDVVTEVQIGDLKNVNASSRMYSADLINLNTYKGTMPDSILISGSATGINFSASCEISIKSGQKWILFLNKNADGEYHLNICSFPVLLEYSDGTPASSLERGSRMIHLFEDLKDLLPNQSTDVLVSDRNNKIDTFLHSYDLASADADTAYYYIELTEDLKMVKSDVLKGLDKNFDRNFTHFLKEITWIEKYDSADESLGNIIKVFVVIYNEQLKQLQMIQ